MKEVFYLLVHLLTTLARLIRPGGSRAGIAENLLLMLDTPSFGQRLIWRASFTNIGVITMRAGLILVGMEPLQSNHQTEISSTSMTIDGRSSAAARFSYRWLLELRFRQGLLMVSGGNRWCM